MFGFLSLSLHASMKNKTRLHLPSDIQVLPDLLLGTYVAIGNDEHSVSCQNKVESLVSIFFF